MNVPVPEILVYLIKLIFKPKTRNRFFFFNKNTAAVFSYLETEKHKYKIGTGNLVSIRTENPKIPLCQDAENVIKLNRNKIPIFFRCNRNTASVVGIGNENQKYRNFKIYRKHKKNLSDKLLPK